ncbi:HET-domain-containing protein [Tothia fuscella]|uniref:HET-domain-containing protein n=1 Tax=Tothia fuscella TaxID=1048955 RepID=A0A9P4TYS1_9PEZI|nr:HET-domain-containing protein [Tothia fuscella]
MLASFNKHWASALFKSKLKCTICKDFTSPEVRASLPDILNRSQEECTGCRLLKDIFERYQVETPENAWVSLVAPTSYTSLYRVQSNIFGPLEIFASEDSIFQFSKIPIAPLISGNTSSEASLQKARIWLKDCSENHDLCKNDNISSRSMLEAKNRSLPRRLLDLSGISLVNMAPSGNIRLVEATKTASGKMASETKYACLSHCWGKALLISTKTTNIDEMHTGVPFQSFPKTFQHAMIVAIKLGVLYIWIDSLCIIQDDPQDWGRESQKMASIYSKGHFTIAASHASGSTEGLFSQPADRYRGNELKVHDTDGTTKPVWIRRPIDHNTWPLLKRSWVYQERLLSRRIVHFAKEEIVWECMQTTVCECSRATSSWPASNNIDSKAQHHISLASSSQVDLADRWRTMVVAYTSMKLTYATDIFPALSGLVKSIEVDMGFGYMAGLWCRSLAVDLLWRFVNNNNNVCTRPTTYLAPSWSWASVLGSVTYDTMGGRRLEHSSIGKLHVEIHDANVESEGVDIHGALVAGSVTLEGVLAPAEAYFDKQNYGYPYLRIGEDERISPQWDDSLINEVFTVDVSSNLFLLKMATTTKRKKTKPATNIVAHTIQRVMEFQAEELEPELICLVLQGEGRYYKRLGYVSRYWPEKEKWFENSEFPVKIIIE